MGLKAVFTNPQAASDEAFVGANYTTEVTV